jgi:hypothetical protein
MNEKVYVTLAPCLFCHRAGGVKIVYGMVATYSPDAGFWVMCDACGLRGPWRPTEAQARAAWNGAVTAHMHEEGEEK